MGHKPRTLPALSRTSSRPGKPGTSGALIGLLDPGATMPADGGGLATATLHQIGSAEQVARFYACIAGREPGLRLLERRVNGQPGLVAQHDGVTTTIFAFHIAGEKSSTSGQSATPTSSGPGRHADTRPRIAGCAARSPVPAGNSRSGTEIRLFHVRDASSPRQATVPPSQIDIYARLIGLVSQTSSPYRTAVRVCSGIAVRHRQVPIDRRRRGLCPAANGRGRRTEVF
jgi:hypothetical protein